MLFFPRNPPSPPPPPEAPPPPPNSLPSVRPPSFRPPSFRPPGVFGPPPPRRGGVLALISPCDCARCWQLAAGAFGAGWCRWGLGVIMVIDRSGSRARVGGEWDCIGRDKHFASRALSSRTFKHVDHRAPEDAWVGRFARLCVGLQVVAVEAEVWLTGQWHCSSIGRTRASLRAREKTPPRSSARPCVDVADRPG